MDLIEEIRRLSGIHSISESRRSGVVLSDIIKEDDYQEKIRLANEWYSEIEKKLSVRWAHVSDRDWNKATFYIGSVLGDHVHINAEIHALGRFVNFDIKVEGQDNPLVFDPGKKPYMKESVYIKGNDALSIDEIIKKIKPVVLKAKSVLKQF